MPRSPLHFLLLIVCCFALAACGDDKDSTETGEGGGTASTSGDAKPAGATTPEAFIDQMEAFALSEKPDIAQLVAFVHPDERGAIAFFMSVIPLMFSGMAAAMAREEKKAELEAIVKEGEALLQKFGLDEESMKAKLGDANPMQDPSSAETIRALSKAMEGVDHVALVREAWQLLDRMGQDKGKVTSSFDPKKFAAVRKSLKQVSPTRAVADDGEGQELVLMKASDGLWYLKFVESGLLDPK